MLFGPLGLQSQLIGHLKRLAQRQDNLISQALSRDKNKEIDCTISILQTESFLFLYSSVAQKVTIKPTKLGVTF